jgi:uncharacterized protein YlxP (DUF503 family)
MVVGVATVTLLVGDAASLKDRRRVVKSVIERVRARFNVAVADVGGQETWNSVTLGIVCVSTEGSHAHAMLEKVVAFIADERLDAEMAHYAIELW